MIIYKMREKFIYYGTVREAGKGSIILLFSTLFVILEQINWYMNTKEMQLETEISLFTIQYCFEEKR